MGITGAKFLELNRTAQITVSAHALDRIAERAGIVVGPPAAATAFCEARRLSYGELLAMGYAPAYSSRAARGIGSWYFRLPLPDCELVAVVSRGEHSGRLAWVTTLAPDAETELRRMFVPVAPTTRPRRARKHRGEPPRHSERRRDRGRLPRHHRPRRRVKACNTPEVREWRERYQPQGPRRLPCLCGIRGRGLARCLDTVEDRGTRQL